MALISWNHRIAETMWELLSKTHAQAGSLRTGSSSIVCDMNRGLLKYKQFCVPVQIGLSKFRSKKAKVYLRTHSRLLKITFLALDLYSGTVQV